MPVELYDLPFDMLEMIGKFYDDLAQRDATATLQATLKRHVVTRCDDPRHTARTNTPGEAPVLCYQYCHKHPSVLIMSFDLIAMQPSWACHSCVSHRQDVRECNGAG